jgi:glycosyltransferase involved in cell wall biosynthesis
MRFHILGLPHTVSSKEFNACAYTQKVVKFGKMMTQRGHHVIHYGHEDSDLICSEHVTVLTNEDFNIAYGDHDWRKNFFKFDTNDHAYQTFYKNAIREVGKRKQKNDFILPFWGSGVRPICDAHEEDMIVVEPGIGYAGGHWARWKVWESYAIMHAWYGLAGVGNCQSDWYNVVIPNYFDLDDFEYEPEKKEDYFLFLGRVYEGKGIHIATQVTEKLGAKLIIAGQNPDNLSFPDNVEFFGYADTAQRKQLMSRAKAAFVPSMYIEPFGGVQIEMLLSGTPTISTDWGSFTENNINGITGYRCNTFDHFLTAARNINKIKPENCRLWGENFSLENVAPMYEEFFQNILNVYTGKGWYQENSTGRNLDFMSKNYPGSYIVKPNNSKELTKIDYDTVWEEEKPMADRLAIWIKDKIQPRKVVDIGSGPGIHVYALRENDIEAYGYDTDDRVIGKEYLQQISMFDLNDPADLVLCFEVAEHIKVKLSDNVIDSIIRNIEKNGKLIWTAAQPGQGGVGHINCQYKDYWNEKFLAKGLTRNFELEEDLLKYMSSGYYMGWFLNNVMVFDMD